MPIFTLVLNTSKMLSDLPGKSNLSYFDLLSQAMKFFDLVCLRHVVDFFFGGVECSCQEGHGVGMDEVKI